LVVLAAALSALFTLVGLVLGFVLAVRGCLEEQAAGPATATKPAEPPVEVTVENLACEFRDNIIRYRQTYVGRAVRVRGKVSAVRDENITRERREDCVILGDVLQEVICIPTVPSATASLKKGQEVTVTGTVVDSRISPLLEKCQIQ
jgi:hypothetical protein